MKAYIRVCKCMEAIKKNNEKESVGKHMKAYEIVIKHMKAYKGVYMHVKNIKEHFKAK